MSARHLLPLPLLALALATAVGATLGPPVVDRVEKFPALGFGFARSARLEARQVPPDAADMLLIFAPKDAPEDRSAPSTQRVYRISAPDLDEVEVREWARGVFPTADLRAERSVRTRYGRKPVRLTGAYVTDGQQRSLFMHAWVGPADAVVFVGECEAELYRRERRAFERAADSFKFFGGPPAGEDRERWEKRYRRTGLPFEAERIDLCVKLADGWTVTDTRSTIILFHGPRHSPVPAQLAGGLSAVRSALGASLPADEPISSLAVVRICRDRGEYLTYGGSPATVGYFNPSVGELVLYDARTEREGAIPLDHPTARTLYHEVCHQYLHQVMSAAAPHTWFGEGLAEYYAGARIRSGRVVAIDPLDDQLAYLRRPDVRAALPPLGELMNLSKPAFYADAAHCYPYSYALVRFLETSPEAQARGSWSALVERYFEALRRSWREEARGLALEGLSERGYERAVARSQQLALEAALEGVDLPELERALRDWIGRAQG
ncbi:MAG: hypothetical protein P8M11_04715 [Planctomycetota bacterium]|nr:hypothetical protein [Planctomycetota bacterium]